jgi:flavin reductase (DIM6/NTAB) family NADH-FMN oxidoreductase RutF
MQANSLSPTPLAFRQAMSTFATGITIVTTRHGHDIHGLTVNAFCSVSLKPMQVLVCIDKQAFSHDLIAAGRNFAVNVLSDQQQELARRFSNNELDAAQRFEKVAHRRAHTGAPILDEALAWLDCEVAAAYEGGDHTIFMGKVVALGKGESRPPLVYFQSGYHTLNDR